MMALYIRHIACAVRVLVKPVTPSVQYSPNGHSAGHSRPGMAPLMTCALAGKRTGYCGYKAGMAGTKGRHLRGCHLPR